MAIPPMAARQARTRHWCFTINNWTEDTEQLLGELGEDDGVEYLVFGREVAPETGTRHLQGFVTFAARRRFDYVRRSFPGAHIEAARGTPYEAAEYCKKDGDFEQFGTPPKGRGSSSNRGVERQFDVYKDWLQGFIEENGRRPYEREIALEHTSLFCRYGRAILRLTELISPAPRLEEGELRDWQIDLNNIVSGEGTDRVIHFVVDQDGGKGKSYFQRWFYTNNAEKTQLLAPGKRDDIAHAIDVSKTVFFFNVPRGGMEFLQYTILEQLKDRCVFSPKYESQMKVLLSKVHVVVFSNEHPLMDKMTPDRYDVREL